MSTTNSVLLAAVGTVLSNAVAAAVAFGAPLSTNQQHVLLILIGSVSALVFTVVSLVHVHTTSSAVKLATAVPVPASSAATAPAVLPLPPQVGPPA